MLRISKAVKADIGKTTLRAAAKKNLGRRPVLVEILSLGKIFEARLRSHSCGLNGIGTRRGAQHKV